MTERLTVTDIAERVGVHKSTVSRQVRAWGLVGDDGLVDVAAYLARRDDTLNPAQQRKPAATPRAEGYSSASAREKAAKAELAEMQVQERRGELVPRAAIEATYGPLTRQLRDDLIAIPRDTVLDPVHATDTENAIIAALARFSDRVRAMLPATNDGGATPASA